MPKQSGRILGSDRELRSASSTANKIDYRIKGAPGLQLRVTASGSKSWALAYKNPSTGKWSKFKLGSYPSMPLAEAKQRAQELAVDIRKGKDPIRDKRSDALRETFDALSKRYMKEHETRNTRNGVRSRSTEEAQRVLDRDILPTLGRIRAELISRANVAGVVEAVADRGAFRAADKTLTLLRSIFNWGCNTGRLDRNPTLGLKKRNSSRPRRRVLNDAEIRIFWQSIESMRGMSVDIRDALRLQLLTGLRINEVTEAARSEIDFKEKHWIVPAFRTKSKRDHVLPLSDFALNILRQVFDRGDHNASRRAARYGTSLQQPTLLFSSRSGISPLSPVRNAPKWARRVAGSLDPHAVSRSIVRCRAELEKAGIEPPFNTHDLRRSVATHLGGMGVADEVIEQILNHAPRSVAGKHYNHAKRINEMRSALDTWSLKVQSILASENAHSNVIGFRTASSRL